MLFKKITRKLVIKIGIYLQKVDTAIAQITLPEFGNNPKNLRIDLPRNIANPDRIFLGNDIKLGPGTLLIPLISYPGSWMQHAERPQIKQIFNSKITIGNRVTSTGGLQIGAHCEVTIGDDVMFATNINITDGLHGHESANEPYKYQPISRVAPITIKRGCWIGQNVVILPGITIGEFSIIGANSVVTKSIPDRSIALGNPAKIVKKWDEVTHRWVSVEKADGRDTITEGWETDKISELRAKESK